VLRRRLLRGWIYVLLAGSKLLTAAPDATVSLDSAMNRLYNADYPGALRILNSWTDQHPADPVGHALKAAAYMFSEFSRLQVLESEFFEDDKRFISKKKLTYDPAMRSRFYQEIETARKLANDRVAKNPNDKDALFSLTISGGLLTDYTSLVEKKNLTSLSYAKESQARAVTLLKIDPNFGDAYLTTGFSEYLLGSLPFFVRWFTRFDGTEGNKELAIQKLQKAAQTGHYLKPFAKLLLAIVYLREKEPEKSQALLAELAREYPENPLLKTELAKVTKLLQSSKR
jgi:predicted Zn-dependent protease